MSLAQSQYSPRAAIQMSSLAVLLIVVAELIEIRTDNSNAANVRANGTCFTTMAYKDYIIVVRF